MVRTAAAIAMVAATLLLAGCAPAARPTPLTEDEVAEFESELRDQLWTNTGMDDSLRPKVAFGDYVATDRIAEVFSECMAASPQSELNTGIAEYRCTILYPLSPNDQGYFSAAERSAIYEYYQKSLVPCLELHGMHVTSAPPRPAADDGPDVLDWNPYWTLQQELVDTSGMDVDCPMLPSWAWSG